MLRKPCCVSCSSRLTDGFAVPPSSPHRGAACLRSQLRHSQCQTCQDVCPLGAITFSTGLAEIDADTCVSFARCLFVCPTTSITDLIPPQHADREGMLIAPFSPIPPTPEELLLWHDEFHIRAVEMDVDEHSGWLLSLAELNLCLARLGEPAWTLTAPPQNSVNSGRRRCYLCGACIKICPQRAIALSQNELTLDPFRCNGCKACENVWVGDATVDITVSEGITPSPTIVPSGIPDSCNFTAAAFSLGPVAWLTTLYIN